MMQPATTAVPQPMDPEYQQQQHQQWMMMNQPPLQQQQSQFQPQPPMYYYQQPPPQQAAAAPPLPAQQQPKYAVASQPTSADEIRTLWIGDLQYWMDEQYLVICFAQSGEVFLLI